MARKEGVRGTVPRMFDVFYKRNFEIRVIRIFMSRREIKIDVWKHLGRILIGLYEVSLLFLDDHNRARSLPTLERDSWPV